MLLWLHQPYYHKRMTENVSLGYSNGVWWGVCTKSRICPSAWQIDTLAQSVTVASTKLASVWLGQGGCNVMRTIKHLSVTRVNTIWRYRWSNLEQDLVSRDEGNGIRCLQINKVFRGMHSDQHGFPELIVDHWLERWLDHVLSIPRPVGCHT
jgi:hypothetical protein